jgi:hypothetical protein
VLLLAGRAQLVTISALASLDPIAATWTSLPLTVAPTVLAGRAAFRGLVNLPMAVAGTAVFVAGFAGQVIHAGMFLVPALMVPIIADFIVLSAKHAIYPAFIL